MLKPSIDYKQLTTAHLCVWIYILGKTEGNYNQEANLHKHGNICVKGIKVIISYKS